MNDRNRLLFSVVIPTFNRSKLVTNAIDSVLKQTEPRFEIILVDNGSTDKTREIVSKYKDPRLQYFYRPPSGGPAWPRNLGIAKSRGEWICFLDSDDIWYEDKLSELADAVTDNGFSMVVHWMLETDQNGQTKKVLKADPYTFSSYRSMLLTENTIVTSSVAVSRHFIEKHGLRFTESESYIAVEDYDLWLRVLLCGGTVSCIRKSLGEMRTPESRTGTIDIFWSRIPNLFHDHVYKIQDFTRWNRLLLRRLQAGLSVRRGIGSIRNKNLLNGLGHIVRAMAQSPLEVIRYPFFRLGQRSRFSN